MADGARRNGTLWHRLSEEGRGLYIDAGQTGGNDQESGKLTRQVTHEGNERRPAFQNKTGSHGTTWWTKQNQQNRTILEKRWKEDCVFMFIFFNRQSE